MHLRKKIITLESLYEAIQEYENLPMEILNQILLDNYTVDLDILAEFTERNEEKIYADTPNTNGDTATSVKVA